MGNAQAANHEISLEELEQLEMQVDEEYNPSGMQSERSARISYLAKLREREAHELRLKYLGKQAKDNKISNHHDSRGTIEAKVKPRSDGPVTYVFQSLEDQKQENENRQPEEAGDKENGEGDSLSDILQQKERIRSIITPNGDPQDSSKRINTIKNADGRSPYAGAQLKVVSINHKNQSQDPVFEKLPPKQEIAPVPEASEQDEQAPKAVIEPPPPVQPAQEVTPGQWQEYHAVAFNF